MKLKLLLAFGCLVAGVVADASYEDSDMSSQFLAASKPNFLLIMPDDQDLKLDSLSYTPLTMNHMAKKGTTFANHFVTTALCCPSRVSLLTGRQAHNTNVTDVNPPWGKPEFLFSF
jgi:arylsulfatase A-like enzyme